MKSEKLNQEIKVEFTNKYNNENPYYTDETALGIKDHKEVINNRLDEIDKKDINYLEK